jgi:hypothetical protein
VSDGTLTPDFYDLPTSTLLVAAYFVDGGLSSFCTFSAISWLISCSRVLFFYSHS